MSKKICFDPTRCGGCYACVVACMDQNDIFDIKKHIPFRTVYTVQHEDYQTPIYYLSTACRHCADSPCLAGCPTGAIYRDDVTDAVRVNPDLCIGCRSCAMACPFGVPRFGPDGKMEKCDLCSERLRAGLLPACVQACPTQALTYADENEIREKKRSLNVEASIKLYEEAVHEES